MSCADAGFVGYRHDGPQFQNMGVSSTRLCMYLQCGLPVIALKQDSFQFLQEFNCGVLITAEDAIPEAVSALRANQVAMSHRSREAIQEVGQMASRYAQILNAVRELI